MRMYIIGALILALIMAGLYFFTPMLVFMLAGGSMMVTVIAMAVIIKVIPRRMYPTQVTILEDRYGGVAITQQGKAKRTTGKDGNDYYSFMGGGQVKAPSSSSVITGDPNLVMLYTPDQTNYFPIEPEIATHYEEVKRKSFVPDPNDPSKNIETEIIVEKKPIMDKAKLKMLNEDQRTFVATQIRANEEATKTPLTNIAQILQLMSVVVPAVLLIGLFLIATNVLPEYFNEMKGQIDESTGNMEGTIQEFTFALQSTTLWKDKPQPVDPDNPEFG